MTKQEAINKIVENFDSLYVASEQSGCKPETKAVWFHSTDHADSYEVDEEWLGVTREGKIAWAYASGCSCWDGDFSEDVCDDVSMKEFTFQHEDMKEEWETKLIEFASKL